MKNNIQILYIDDNAMDRALVKDALEVEHGGFELSEASSQVEFEKLFSSKEFDLVLTDFNILGFEGDRVLEKVKSVLPNLPVIIVTGTGSEEIAVRLMKKGASDYVIKSPSHIKRLPNTILTVLKEKQTRLEKEKAEQAFSTSQAMYKTLFDLLPAGFTISDSEGNIIESNPYAEELLGISVDEQVSRSIDSEEWKMLRPDASLMPFEEFASVRALKENEIISNVEMGIDKGDEGITWINVCAAPIPLENYGVMIIYFDITDRVNTTNELKLLKTQLENLVEERTQELMKKNNELEDFNQLFVGREFRIKELREKVKELELIIQQKE